MAENRERDVIHEKTFVYQQPNILQSFEDGYVIRQMSYEDIRFV